MTKYMHYEENGNLKNRIISGPVRLSEMDFESLYDDISSNWKEKAQRLQARRMRKIKQQLV